MPDQEPSQYEARLVLLQRVRALLDQWDSEGLAPTERSALRSEINRLLQATKQALTDAGLHSILGLRAPLAAGGGTFHHDVISSPFDRFFGGSLIPYALDRIDQAIGVYENLRDDTGFVRMPQPSGLDIEGAIERALRPSFLRAAPDTEKQVQDAIEVILRSLGVDYTREKEVAPVGPKAFKPDFVLEALDLALEVKLATQTHGERDIQEELAADIAAYRTRWKHLLVVVYDNGVISDPYQLRKENMKHFGVTVVVVKH